MKAVLPLQVPWEKREELLIKGGLDPKKDLLNLTLRYDVGPPPAPVLQQLLHLCRCSDRQGSLPACA